MKLSKASHKFELPAEYAQILADFESVLKTATSAKDVAWLITEEVISKLNWQDAIVYLYSPQKKCLMQVSAFGSKSYENRQIKSPIRITPGEGIVGRAFVAGIPLMVNDTSTNANYIIDDRFRLSEIAVPIIGENGPIGVLDSEHTSERFYTTVHKQLLTAVADLCAPLIEAFGLPD